MNVISHLNATFGRADEEEMDDGEEKDEPASARPRRMSEISSKNSTKPIPKGSAFFIFSHQNK